MWRRAPHEVAASLQPTDAFRRADRRRLTTSSQATLVVSLRARRRLPTHQTVRDRAAAALRCRALRRRRRQQRVARVEALR